jgi:lipocalin
MRSFFLVAVAACVTGCMCAPVVDNSSVPSLDLDRYLGTWYEIARFDHSFERGVEAAKAVYTLNKDGSVKVVNSGLKAGKPKTAVGKGKRTDKPGLLRVSFFGPFYADYRVMRIDADYNYALVGSGGAGYLWILSRTKEMPEKVKVEFLAEAKRRGYDTGKLIWVNHEEK